jgi:hypothetical protein
VPASVETHPSPKRESEIQSDKFSERPRTPAAERTLAENLEELAHRDPQSAMARALAENNRRLRAILRNAVLRGWAASDPRKAGEWAMALPDHARDEAAEAVLTGAVANPDAAIELARAFATQDSAHAADYGQVLIAALANAGEFKRATDFVAGNPTSPLRLEQMNSTFSVWAQHQPEQAAAAVNAITDPALREEAFRGMAIGWATADPAALAGFAVNLSPGEQRAQALANALPRWVEEDPVAASAWIAQHDSNADFDMGIIAIANMPQSLAERPEASLRLVESVADVPLRTNTLRTLALKWAERDPAAARRYVESSTGFSVEERTSLLNEIGQSLVANAANAGDVSVPSR